MPATKVIKSEPVEVPERSLARSRPVKVKPVNGARAALQVPAVRKSRASSCPRCPQRSPGAQRTADRTGCDKRTRSSSTAPKTKTTNCPGTNPDQRRANNSAKHRTVSAQCRGRGGEQRGVQPEPKHGGQREQRGVQPDPKHGGQTEQRGVQSDPKHPSQSTKAFTVIPPDPKKRREIQRKAEAELAALEELRLSRAMAYVSINPSSVGGCMSLEEVRSKQQQEMMQAKRKHKPMKTQVMECTSVLRT